MTLLSFKREFSNFSLEILRLMTGCVTGKKMYLTAETAEQALVNAWVKNDYTGRKGPLTFYRCDDCGQFHLTSSGEMNSTLAQLIKDGKLKLQQEANYWEDKFKRTK